MNPFLMREEIGVHDQMIIVVRDMINDPSTSLPPQGVQHEAHLLVTHPVITPVQPGLTSRNKRKPRARFGVSHAALHCLSLTSSSK